MNCRIFAFVFAFFVTPVIAQSTDGQIHWCDGCSLKEKADLVSNLSSGSAVGASIYYVGDLSARVLSKYKVEKKVVGTPCPHAPVCNPPLSLGDVSGQEVVSPASISTEITELPVEGDIAEGFGSAMQFYYTDPVGWQKQYDVQIIDLTNPSSATYKEFYKNGKFSARPAMTIYGESTIVPVTDFPDPHATVYDVVNYGPKQVQFLDYFLSQGPQQFKVASGYLLKSLSFLNLFNADHLPAQAIVVRFSDGGQITVVLDKSTSAPHYVIDESSARDSHGNPVPVRQEHIKGRISNFSFGGAGNASDKPNMRSQLSGLGADMSGVSVEAMGWSCGTNVDGSDGVTCYEN